MDDQILKDEPVSATDRSIPLTATIVENKVEISGNGGATLSKDSGAHRFKFTIVSPPGLIVKFCSLDREDNCSTCPPAKGDNSEQIVGVTIGSDGRTAAFTDKNDNKGGEIDVCYQWNFTCDDPAKQVEPFDPVIKNGGTTR